MSEPEDPDHPLAPPPPPEIEPPPPEIEVVPSELPPELPPEPAAPEPPIAPPTDDDLREAVGVARREKVPRARTRDRDRDRDRDDDDERDARDRELDDAPPLTPEQRASRRRLWLTLSFSLVFGLIIVAFVFLGRANSDRLVFHCAADKITAEEGRGFPPWGTRELDGPEWAPIAIPPSAECKTRETEEPSVFEGWYLDALVDEARTKLGAREVTAVDEAEKQLRQALLLARAPERRDQRREIERLLGDVVYWRGAAKVKVATDALADAAKLFDEAAAKKPVKVTDAAAWGDYARHLADELHLGPESLRPPPSLGVEPPPTRPTAPTGVALPVEDTSPDAAMGTPLTPPDAGMPSGGVLL